MTLLFYAAFQVFSTFAIWQHVFAVQDYYIDVFDQRVNLKHWLFAAQVNAAIIATRFAVRSGDSNSLIFCAGLVRVRMRAAEALELRALMLAEKTTRQSNISRSSVVTNWTRGSGGDKLSVPPSEAPG